MSLNSRTYGVRSMGNVMGISSGRLVLLASVLATAMIVMLLLAVQHEGRHM